MKVTLHPLHACALLFARLRLSAQDDALAVSVDKADREPHKALITRKPTLL